MMNRRGFLGMAAASIFVPQFGRFFREGSGSLWTPAPHTVIRGDWTLNAELNAVLKQIYEEYRQVAFPTKTPLLSILRREGVSQVFASRLVT